MCQTYHRSLVTNNTIMDSPAAVRKDEPEDLALMSVQDNNESKL